MKTLPFLLASLLLISCSSTTKSLWENSTYKEKVSTFLITKDGEKLAIIGDKYHYIFKLESSLKNILLSKKRNQIKPLFYSFKVDDNNNVSGGYSLKYNNKNRNDNAEIENLGFKNKTYKNRKNSIYSFTGSINGQRYTTNKDINANYKFNKPYIIKVEEPSTFLGNIGKILATPIAVAADGVKTIAGIVLIPIAAIVLTNTH